MSREKLEEYNILQRTIYMIQFVAYNAYSGLWKRALMSDFYSFTEGGEI